MNSFRRKHSAEKKYAGKFSAETETVFPVDTQLNTFSIFSTYNLVIAKENIVRLGDLFKFCDRKHYVGKHSYIVIGADMQ